MMRWRKTDAPAVQMALRLLPQNQVKMGGVILTQIDMQKQASYGFGDPGFYYKQYKEYYTESGSEVAA